MAAKQWTLLSKVISDCIKLPDNASIDNVIRAFQSCGADYASISSGVRGYGLKAGTLNAVAQTIVDIRTGKITELSQITIAGTSDSSEPSGAIAETGPSDTTEHNGNLNSTISRIPITDPEEAMQFAKTEWNKIRRTSGHELECQVFGSHYWKVGEWCKVYIPQLNEYTDMYITKVDNSNDSGSEWLVNLTLMDYAPSLSTLDEDKVKETSDETSAGNGESGSVGDDGTGQTKWTSVAEIIQKYFEKPSDGWDNHIRALLASKTYDPDIKNDITKLVKKQEFNHTAYVDIGHELCNVLGIGY